MQSPMQSLVSLHPAIIVVALLMAAAFCVAGLMIQHDVQRSWIRQQVHHIVAG